MKLRVLCVVALLPLTLPAYAEEVVDKGWTGRADLGYFSQSGSDGGKESLTAKAEAKRTWGYYTLENQAQAVSSSDDKANSGTERYLISSKQSFKLDKSDYVFLKEQWEKDSTSDFRYQMNFTGGYGRELIKNDEHTLVGELGVGVRYSKRRVGDSETSPVGTGALDYKYVISKTVNFHQRLGVEGGTESIIARSLTELRVQLRDELGLAIGYDVKREFSDNNQRLSLTTVSLSYGF
ncbi:YdiY family protein [Paraperlucidibaca wandonensis]|uniref:YdiY family protein n=1 Tax=Paraperlucidibaca wandonensis TaxID=1268273 RepID=A0ABW3HIY8_9GAMM|tara:strand:+ start:30881 stop:31591 length:711 start_codon:yes stop_codon:yes gene_type:complete